MLRPTRQCVTNTYDRIKQIQAWENLHDDAQEVQQVAKMIQAEFELEETLGVVKASDWNDDDNSSNEELSNTEEMDAETIVETMTRPDTDDSSEVQNVNTQEEEAAAKTGADPQADAVQNQQHTPIGNESRAGNTDNVQDIAGEALQDDGSSVSNGESYSELSDSDEYESSFVTSDDDECDSEDDWQPPSKKPKCVLL